MKYSLKALLAILILFSGTTALQAADSVTSPAEQAADVLLPSAVEVHEIEIDDDRSDRRRLAPVGA